MFALGETFTFVTEGVRAAVAAASDAAGEHDVPIVGGGNAISQAVGEGG